MIKVLLQKNLHYIPPHATTNNNIDNNIINNINNVNNINNINDIINNNIIDIHTIFTST